MLNPFQWVAVFGMIGIAVLFLIEASKWPSMEQIMGRGQRVLRLLTFVAVELLFALMLIGPSVMARKDPLISLTYWSICLALGLSVIALALLIMLAALRSYSNLNRRAFRQLKEGPAPDGSRGSHPESRRRARPGNNGRKK